MKHTGGSMSPFTAWIMLNGMVTLDLRCRAMAEGAEAVARALEGDARLASVIYPGSRAIRSMTSCSGRRARAGRCWPSTSRAEGGGLSLLNALEIVKISNNLGDAKTIATHPATTTHQRLPDDQKAALGITPGLVRLSVGLEDAGDLIADLKRALDAV